MKEAFYREPTKFMRRCVKFIPPDTGILERCTCSCVTALLFQCNLFSKTWMQKEQVICTSVFITIHLNRVEVAGFFTFSNIQNSNTGVLLYGASVGELNVVWTVLLIRILDVLNSYIIPETSYFEGTSSWFTQLLHSNSRQYIKADHTRSLSQTSHFSIHRHSLHFMLCNSKN